MIRNLSFLRCCSLRSLGSVATWVLLCSLDPRSAHCFCLDVRTQKQVLMNHRHAGAPGSPFHAHSLWDPNILQPLPHPWKVFLQMSEVWVSCRFFFFLSPPYVERRNVPGGSAVKKPAVNAGDTETQVQSLGWKIPWRRKWQPIPIFLPGESHGQRSLASNSPWGCKSQTRLSACTTECVRAYTHTHTLI